MYLSLFLPLSSAAPLLAFCYAATILTIRRSSLRDSEAVNEDMYILYGRVGKNANGRKE